MNKGTVILSEAGAVFCTCGVEGSAVVFRQRTHLQRPISETIDNLYVNTA
jgi:hypothetical protein